MKQIITTLLPLAIGFLSALNLYANPVIEAPTSISNRVLIVNLTTTHTKEAILVFGVSTFTNFNGNYGIYTYDLTNATHAVLTLTHQDPSNYGDVTTIDLTFKTGYSGSLAGQVVEVGGDRETLKGSFTFDVTKPKVSITSPRANLKWSDTNITVTGKASDNVGVANVWVQINDGGWVAADSGSGFTNWYALNLPVVIGQNILQACAVDASGNISETNTVKFTGVSSPSSGFAPASLSGYAAKVKMADSGQTIAMTWGDDTWAQTGTGNDTNADDYCAGTYTYVQTGPDTAVLTNMDIGMMSWLGTTNVTTVNVTFTSATSATCTWTNGNDSGSATLTLSHVENLVPASLADKKLTARNTVFVFAADGTFTESKSGSEVGNGTCLFTQYSPTVAILQLNWTDAGDAGALAYVELTFTSATSVNIAQSWYANPQLGSNPDDWGLATGTIK